MIWVYELGTDIKYGFCAQTPRAALSAMLYTLNAAATDTTTVIRETDSKKFKFFDFRGRTFATKNV